MTNVGASGYQEIGALTTARINNKITGIAKS